MGVLLEGSRRLHHSLTNGTILHFYFSIGCNYAAFCIGGSPPLSSACLPKPNRNKVGTMAVWSKDTRSSNKFLSSWWEKKYLCIIFLSFYIFLSMSKYIRQCRRAIYHISIFFCFSKDGWLHETMQKNYAYPVPRVNEDKLSLYPLPLWFSPRSWRLGTHMS